MDQLAGGSPSARKAITSTLTQPATKPTTFTLNLALLLMLTQPAIEVMMHAQPINPTTGAVVDVYASRFGSSPPQGTGLVAMIGADDVHFPGGLSATADPAARAFDGSRITHIGSIVLGGLTFDNLDGQRDFWMGLHWNQRPISLWESRKPVHDSPLASDFDGPLLATAGQLRQGTDRRISFELASADPTKPPINPLSFEGFAGALRLTGGHAEGNNSRMPQGTGSFTTRIRIRERAGLTGRIWGMYPDTAANRLRWREAAGAIALDWSSYATSAGTLPNDEWSEVWVSFDAPTQTFTRRDPAGTFESFPFIPPPTGVFGIGEEFIGDDFAGAFPLAADVDEFAMWGHALTAREMGTRFRKPTVPDDDGLAILYSFDEGIGTEIFNTASLPGGKNHIKPRLQNNRRVEFGTGYAEGATGMTIECVAWFSNVSVGTETIFEVIPGLRIVHDNAGNTINVLVSDDSAGTAFLAVAVPAGMDMQQARRYSVVYDKANEVLELYVDAVLLGSVATGTLDTISGTGTLVIGSTPTDTNKMKGGGIADLRFWIIPRLQVDMENDWNRTLREAFALAPLSDYWHLDDGSGDALNTKGGNVGDVSHPVLWDTGTLELQGSYEWISSIEGDASFRDEQKPRAIGPNLAVQGRPVDPLNAVYFISDDAAVPGTMIPLQNGFDAFSLDGVVTDIYTSPPAGMGSYTVQEIGPVLVRFSSVPTGKLSFSFTGMRRGTPTPLVLGSLSAGQLARDVLTEDVGVDLAEIVVTDFEDDAPVTRDAAWSTGAAEVPAQDILAQLAETTFATLFNDAGAGNWRLRAIVDPEGPADFIFTDSEIVVGSVSVDQVRQEVGNPVRASHSPRQVTIDEADLSLSLQDSLRQEVQEDLQQVGDRDPDIGGRFPASAEIVVATTLASEDDAEVAQQVAYDYLTLPRVAITLIVAPIPAGGVPLMSVISIDAVLAAPMVTPGTLWRVAETFPTSIDGTVRMTVVGKMEDLV